MSDSSAGFWSRFNPILQVTIIYVLLGGIIFVAGRYVPWVRETLMAPDALADPGNLFDVTQTAPVAASPDEQMRVLGSSITAMAMAALLLWPVLVVYTATRSKKGYRQAMVQTLIILPVVVAGVVILVKNSLALAFALGGTVGAVSFRNRLEDPKDAVYVFLSIAVGLACGIQAFPVAYSVSLFFNFVILGMWYSDFGRVPAQMAGKVAQRRIEMARGMVEPADRKGGQFVSLLDQQVLRSMTPDQLSVLADRAIKHRQKMVKEVMEVDDRFDGTLKVVLAAEQQEGVRAAVEGVLFRDAKDWRYDRSADQPGGKVSIEYSVRFRKKIPMPLLLESVRRAALPHAEQVSFE